MTRTITRLFDTRDEVTGVLDDLHAAGFTDEDISLMSSAPDDRPGEPPSFAEPATEVPLDNPHARHGVAKGAAIGGGIGGGAALLIGAGLLAVPGMGPVLAAGFLASALVGAGTGAATGGMLGALRDYGHTDEDAEILAEGVRRGEILVSVKAPESRAANAERILVRHGGMEAAARRLAWHAEGLQGADPLGFDRTAS